MGCKFKYILKRVADWAEDPQGELCEGEAKGSPRRWYQTGRGSVGLGSADYRTTLKEGSERAIANFVLMSKGKDGVSMITVDLG